MFPCYRFEVIKQWPSFGSVHISFGKYNALEIMFVREAWDCKFISWLLATKLVTRRNDHDQTVRNILTEMTHQIVVGLCVATVRRHVDDVHNFTLKWIKMHCVPVNVCLHDICWEYNNLLSSQLMKIQVTIIIIIDYYIGRCSKIYFLNEFCRRKGAKYLLWLCTRV